MLLLALVGCSDSDDPARTWEVAAQGVYSTALSNNGELVVVGSLNHGASLWRAPDHERLFNWAHPSEVPTELVATNFSPDSSRAITTNPRTLVLWDAVTGKALSYWTTPASVLDVALFNNNRNAILGVDDHSALIFDATTDAYLQTLLHQREVGSIALSYDGTLALTDSDDHTAVLWRLNDASKINVFQHGNPVRAVALSPSGKISFTVAQGDLIALWNNVTGERTHTLCQGPNHGVISARFSSDETLLAVGHTNRLTYLYMMSSQGG